jgi:cyclase
MFKRIIGLVLLDQGMVSRTRNFHSDYHYTAEFIDTRFFDEIAFIDISQDHDQTSHDKFQNSVESLMKDSQLPVSMGGGIRSIEDIERFRLFGADRYIINQTWKTNDQFISEIIRMYGKSSVISSISHSGAFIASRHHVSTKSISGRIAEIRSNCGSEILLNSIERDGTLRGLDLETAKLICRISKEPLILSGGVGNATHIEDALKVNNVVGVATSNIYHLTTTTVSSWRSSLLSNGANIRLI